jgi:hypothetical protein
MQELSPLRDRKAKDKDDDDKEKRVAVLGTHCKYGMSRVLCSR